MCIRDSYGTSASGSRLLAGEKSLDRELERALADWKHAEDALVLVGGHSTNVTFVGNFCHDGDLILYDALIHNSVAEGCRLAHATARPFPHNDWEALERILERRRDKFAKVLICVEGVYSMDCLLYTSYALPWKWKRMTLRPSVPRPVP